MALLFGTNLTPHWYTWTNWKTVQYLKNIVTQFDDDGVVYTIYGYDSNDVHICTIYKGTVPDSANVNGVAYSQSQNDSDKSDFETNYKPAGNPAIEPKATDGRINQLPNIFPTTTQVCFTGAGDDPTNGTGAGTALTNISTGSGIGNLSPSDNVVEWQFNDPVYVAGGSLLYNGALLGDTMDYYIYAAANSVSSTPGTGNCDAGTGGNTGKLIPNQAGTGASTVTLATAIPVPNLTNTGYWDWACPTGIGKGTITPNYNHAGGYDLYTVQVKLARLLILIPMLGTYWSKFSIPAIVPKKVLPQWTHHATVHNIGAHTLTTTWYLMLARTKTT